MMVRAAFLTALLFAGPALAQADQANCGPRPKLLGYLSDKFSEQPVMLGLTSDGNVLEVATSANGSWTIVVTLPTGISCAVAAGEKWAKLAPATQISSEDGDF
jgi:hypothetical protein